MKKALIPASLAVAIGLTFGTVTMAAGQGGGSGGQLNVK